jgi:hypothetical protein
MKRFIVAAVFLLSISLSTVVCADFPPGEPEHCAAEDERLHDDADFVEDVLIPLRIMDMNESINRHDELWTRYYAVEPYFEDPSEGYVFECNMEESYNDIEEGMTELCDAETEIMDAIYLFDEGHDYWLLYGYFQTAHYCWLWGELYMNIASNGTVSAQSFFDDSHDDMDLAEAELETLEALYGDG